jgi:hypothetical protein
MKIKGIAARDFYFGFFHESVSPKPLSILVGPLQIFSTNRGDIRSTLIPVVHLDLRISQRIFLKFEMTLILFSGVWGENDSRKNLKRKVSCHCPFKGWTKANTQKSFFKRRSHEINLKNSTKIGRSKPKDGTQLIF